MVMSYKLNTDSCFNGRLIISLAIKAGLINWLFIR